VIDIAGSLYRQISVPPPNGKTAQNNEIPTSK
jgi:hypothetical protein